VWAALVEADKAYGEGEFDTKAFLHQLRSTDWGRPLSEIRDAFWNTPRLPLLPGGDDELRRAIFHAVQAGEARLVDKDGVERKAVTPAEINLSSSGIRLEKPGGAQQEAEVEVPALLGKTRSAAQAALDAAGLVLHGDGDGVVATQEPAAGTTVAASTGVTVTFERAAQARVEHQLAIAKTAALSDASSRDSLRTLLMALQNAVGDGDASHISLNVQVVVTSDVKEDLLAKAEVAGITPKVTDL
jgi:PASTA domain